MMRFILLVVVSSFSFVTISQSVLEHYTSLETKFNAQNYGSAIDIGEKIIQKTEESDSIYLNTLTYLSYAYFYLEDYPKACEVAEKERLLREKHNGRDEQFYSTQYSLGLFCTYIGEWDRAIDLISDCLDFFKETYGENSQFYIGVLGNLASAHNEAGSKYVAEQLYDEMFALVKANYQPTDQIYATTANTVSTFYTTNGAYEKSEPFFLDAVESYEKAYGKMNDNYLAVHNALGEFYIYAAWYKKASEVYEVYIELTEKHYGKKSADHATALNNLAVAYEKEGEFQKAEDIYKTVLKIKEQVYTTESDYYALSLCNLAVLYDRMGKFKEAEKLLNEAIRIYELIYTPEHPDYGTALNNLASIYSQDGQYRNAIELQRKACRIHKKAVGEKSAVYLNSLGNLAQLYVETSQTDSAIILMNDVLEKRKNLLGAEHPDYATTMYNLANLYVGIGEYKKAEILLNSALEIHEKQGTTHPSYVNSLSSLAGVYFETGKFVFAQKIYEESLNLAKEAYGERHPEYATIASNAGLFYFETGELEKSEELLLQAFEILRNAYGLDHQHNVYVMSNLAQVYLARNYYEKAEDYLQRSNELAKDIYGSNSQAYAGSLNSLAVYFYEMGQYTKAENFYNQALEKMKSIYGQYNPQYVTTLSNLGALYMGQSFLESETKEKQRLVDLAEECFLQSLKNDTAMNRHSHPDHAVHLNNLAELYRNYNSRKYAIPLYEKALEIEKANFGENNFHSAVTYSNLALAHYGGSNWNAALDNAEKALRIKHNVYGTETSDFINIYQILADIHRKLGNTEKVFQMYERSFALHFDHLNRNLGFLTEEEKENFFKVNNGISNSYYHFMVQNQGAIEDLNDLGYNAALNIKGILLRSATKLKDAISKTDDPEVIANYEEWIATRQQLAQLYTLEEDKRNVSVNKLEQKAERLEKILTEVSSGTKHYFRGQPNWTEVRDALNENEAAVEYVIQIDADTNKITTFRYAALLLTKDCEHPIVIDLPKSDSLYNKIQKVSGSSKSIVSTLYGEKQKTVSDLYKMIWEPIEKYLDGKTTIYYSPTSMINKISLAALRSEDGTYCSDKYDLRQVTSTANLVDQNRKAELRKNYQLGIFGGIDYNVDSTDGYQEVWTYLEGTANEAKVIERLALKSKISAEKYTGSEATETRMKTLSDSARADIVHIATHGFFYSLEDNLFAVDTATDLAFRGSPRGVNAFVKNPNPLMRSGLAMSGANRVWQLQGEFDIPKNEADDGVLTAYEVSNLDLTSTELVVLSACETGLGEIKGSQGVYGLQRAFKIAGVNKMIMSLWQVPDRETAEFMEIFYQNLFENGDIPKAFSMAQSEMRKKYDPYYWAAFILVE